ncbi:MAG: iron-regulated protein [Deltaproteobacteria bacterium]|nr:iron-regulated protein [Deltaproteobacteria bacterium]
MKMVFNFRCGLLAAALLIGCGGEDDDLDDAPAVVDNYATIVHANYADALAKAVDLKTAIDAFVAAPTAASLEAAKTAWLAAREPYGQTEAFRFYDGPIDNPTDGPEGLINAWPLDEAYVDYVVGDDTAGIINDPAGFPSLTKDIIAEQNEKGAEENVSTGYHAIEFLLWGQDLSTTGPGARPHTDYLSVGGTAANQARRGQYLKAIAELLVDHLTTVRDAWVPGGANYGRDFRALAPREAVRRVMQGLGSLSGAELSGERMATAFDNRDQEDEHSCFSDNTHRDLRANALSLQNVYLGRYAAIDGPGFDELVRARDAQLDAKMQAQLADSIAKIEAIPVPFDQALLDDANGRPKIRAAIDALLAQTETMVEVATLLGIKINIE